MSGSTRRVLAGVFGVWACTLTALATEPPVSDERPRPASSSPRTDDAARRDEAFRRLVTNVKLSGHFTIDGAGDGVPKQEEYVITSATKLGAGDAWLLTARITYGDVDVAVPVPVQVKWAGDTPVITLDDVGLPGLGTFSARVVLHDGRYAGTWSHDRVGGHLFGTIAPAAAGPADKPE
jgi:hypothetical protein